MPKTTVIAILVVIATLTLTVLRLADVINWPWGWVFAPLWIAVLVLLFFIGWILDL